MFSLVNNIFQWHCSEPAVKIVLKWVISRGKLIGWRPLRPETARKNIAYFFQNKYIKNWLLGQGVKIFIFPIQFSSEKYVLLPSMINFET